MVLSRGCRKVPSRRTKSNSSAVVVEFVALFRSISCFSSGERGSEISLRRFILRVGPFRRSSLEEAVNDVSSLCGMICGVGTILGVGGIDFGIIIRGGFRGRGVSFESLSLGVLVCLVKRFLKAPKREVDDLVKEDLSWSAAMGPQWGQRKSMG